MIAYINPLKILAVSRPDEAAIVAALHRTLAAFDANQGQMTIEGQNINKSDFLHFLDLLKDEQKAAYFLDLYKELSPLDDFLSHGAPTFFENFDSLLFKYQHLFADNNFLNFIAPFYSHQLQSAILAAYQAPKNNQLNNVLKGLPLLLPAYEAQGFEKITTLLQEQLRQLAASLTQLAAQENKQLIQQIQALIDIDKLNALPPYFDAQRNAIANGICNIAIHFYNKYENTELAAAAFAIAEKIHSSKITTEHISQNYNHLKRFLTTKQAQKNTAATQNISLAQNTPLSENPKPKLSNSLKAIIIGLPILLLIFLAISEYHKAKVAEEERKERIYQEEQRELERAAEEKQSAAEARAEEERRAAARAEEERRAAAARAEEARAAQEEEQAADNYNQDIYYITWVSSVRMRDYPSLSAEATYIIPEGAQLISRGYFSDNEATVELRGYTYTAPFVKVYYPDGDVEGWVHLATLKEL